MPLRRRDWMLAGGALLLASGAGAQEARDPREAGPLGLAIAVNVRPPDRARLRAVMQQQGLAQFERWRQDGVLAGYRLLMSRYADAPNWDLLVVLRFASYPDLARWHAIERTAPAGLPKAVAALATEVRTTPMDLLRSGRADSASARPTFLIVPYDYLVSLAEYLRYADGYLVPQLSGWISEGIVSHYGLHVARYGAGRAWSSMLEIAYRDDESLGSRDRVVAKVRAALSANPEWKAWHEKKDKIRTEGAPVVADDLAPA